ncbi:hypothetical protein FKM82_023036 [Ascaphus truei]
MCESTLSLFSLKKYLISSLIFLSRSGIFRRESFSFQFALGLSSPICAHLSSIGAWSDHEISWIPVWVTAETSLLEIKK